MKPEDFRNYSLGPFAILAVAHNELLAFARNKSMLISMIMSPLITYGLLVMSLSKSMGQINYEGITISYTHYALPGVMAFFLTTQMSHAMYRATIDKTYGLLAYKILNGVRPLYYLIGMSTLPALGFICQAAVLFVLGAFTGGIYSAPGLLLSILNLLACLLFWTSVGIVLSSTINSYEQRDVLMTILFSPLAYASPVLYVIDSSSPLIIRILSAINPLTYQLATARSLAMGRLDITSLGIAVALTVLALCMASYILKRMKLSLEAH